jgi:hypothetical protein
VEEGCGWLLLILVIIGIIIAAIYFIILAIAYTLAFLGLSIIIPLDFFGSTFTWIGISSPSTGWLLYGCFIGAVIGLVKGLKKAGRTSDLWKVYLGATILFTLLFFGSYMAYSSEGMWTREPQTVITNTASTVTPPSLPGMWTGTFSDKPATLVINNGKGNDFSGTLTVDQTRLAVSVTVTPNSQQVVIKEVRVLSKGPNWALGVDTGSFSNDGRHMSGTGRDSRGTSYSWSFTKK